MNKQNHRDNGLTRRKAVSQLGKYAALTALGTFVILNPLRAQSGSPPNPGGNPFDWTAYRPMDKTVFRYGLNRKGSPRYSQFYMMHAILLNFFKGLRFRSAKCARPLWAIKGGFWFKRGKYGLCDQSIVTGLRLMGAVALPNLFIVGFPFKSWSLMVIKIC